MLCSVYIFVKVAIFTGIFFFEIAMSICLLYTENFTLPSSVLVVSFPVSVITTLNIPHSVYQKILITMVDFFLHILMYQ